MENQLTWILIADASKARIFSVHKAKLFSHPEPSLLKLIKDLKHDASRKKNAELVSDGSGANNKGSFVPAHTPKEVEALHFAKELSRELEIGLGQQHYRDLILIAPSNFMGLMLANLNSAVVKAIDKKIEKDYAHCTVDELLNHLVSHL